MADDTYRELLAVAATQHGTFTTAQAHGAGLTQRQIDRRVAAGLWLRVARGVYAVGGTAPDPLQPMAAATLLRPDGAISHLTAAWVHGLVAGGAPPVHLTVPPSTTSTSPLATVHRLEVSPSDLVSRRGVTVTSAARTLVDCSTIVGPRRLAAMVDQAIHERVAMPRRIQGVAASVRHLTRGQRQALAEPLAVWLDPIRPESPAEARLLRAMVQWGLPPPERQVPIIEGTGTTIASVDVGWADRRLGVEYDSVRWHGPAAWEHDEQRARRLADLGWVILHAERHDLLPGEHLFRDALLQAYTRAAPRRAG